MIPDELPLSRALVDRAAHLRADASAVDDARADPTTRVLLVGDSSVVLSADGELALLTPADADEAAATLEGTPADEPGTAHDAEQWLLLGADDGGRYLARRVRATRPAPPTGSPSDVLVHRREAPPAPRELPSGLVRAALRTVGADLGARDAGLATAAVALDAWHSRHPRCPRCGGPTRITQAGWVRTCEVDGSEHYPRTDPAVIMAVIDDADRLLLGHAAAWAAGRWSTLAGFVEAGESLEHAVRREVLEETGVVVGEVKYRGSQPWPFPASLMVGFHARATTGDVRVDGVELTDARWFTREELARAVVDGEVIPPGRSSIARALVEDWFGGPLPAGAAAF
ncbi:NAD(+) diphosphatase [Cellulomonas alba]|uniref:NAD(+) diphosphatase n=1 Tax=Cellulomonas alba TaxID=3053467 RepID=A0ABT7SF84_9CELL|nr:NAD(+) diphosphatase [Cellulomonas alba]MDM7854189.1 NAD(+) diphosphatase [Cellulomonas alba]